MTFYDEGSDVAEDQEIFYALFIAIYLVQVSAPVFK